MFRLTRAALAKDLARQSSHSTLLARFSSSGKVIDGDTGRLLDAKKTETDTSSAHYCPKSCDDVYVESTTIVVVKRFSVFHRHTEKPVDIGAKSAEPLRCPWKGPGHD